MKEFMIILVGAALVDNLVLVRGLGICPTVKLAASAGRSLLIGGLVTLAMLLGAAVTWPLERYLLEPFQLEFFRNMLMIPMVCVVGFVMLRLVQTKLPGFCTGGICLNSLLVTNCAVVGMVLINAQKEFGFWESLTAALGGGLGFTLVLVIFAGMRNQIDKTKGIPEAFRGIPSYLAAAAILSVVLTAFSGAIAGLFA